MTILWLRHGETALNAARIMQPADTPLSPRGLAQAEAAARRIAAMRPAAILASDMPRALQTAAALARLTGLAVAPDARLRERNFGALRGRPWSTLAFDPTAMLEAPEGGESMVHRPPARRHAAALRGGRGRGRHVRACYPFVRVHTDTVARADSRLAYGFVAGPGVYETTLTRPDLFATTTASSSSCCCKTTAWRSRSAPARSRSRCTSRFAEHDHIEGSADAERRQLMRDLFDLPDLAAMDDGIANGT
jgi:hypothetical protein